jgi:hypothetical protein
VEAGATGHHFICFTQVGDEVVEFDGVKPLPTHHKLQVRKNSNIDGSENN